MSSHPYHPHCGCDECGNVEEAREALAEREAEIVDAWMADPAKVAEALDDIGASSDTNSDGNTHFSADLAAMLAATGTDALQYVERLREQVRGYLRRDAETDAWAEAEQFRQRGEEARWERAA